MKKIVSLALLFGIALAFGLAVIGRGNGGSSSQITGVSILGVSSKISKGVTRTLGATVAGYNNPSQSVQWVLEGNKKNGTSLNNGVLVVAGNETASSLTVKAISTIDSSKYDQVKIAINTVYVLDDDYYEQKDGKPVTPSTSFITGLERFNGKYLYTYGYLTEDSSKYVCGYHIKGSENSISQIKNGIGSAPLFNDQNGESPYIGNDFIWQFTIVIVDDPDGDGYIDHSGVAPWDTGNDPALVPCCRGIRGDLGDNISFENGRLVVDWNDL